VVPRHVRPCKALLNDVRAGRPSGRTRAFPSCSGRPCSSTQRFRAFQRSAAGLIRASIHAARKPRTDPGSWSRTARSRSSNGSSPDPIISPNLVCTDPSRADEPGREFQRSCHPGAGTARVLPAIRRQDRREPSAGQRSRHDVRAIRATSSLSSTGCPSSLSFARQPAGRGEPSSCRWSLPSAASRGPSQPSGSGCVDSCANPSGSCQGP
jgi:hypothetical protein